jgi:hypothetical protein
MSKTEHARGESGLGQQRGLSNKPAKAQRRNPFVCFELALIVTFLAAALSLLFPALNRPYYLFVAAIAFSTWYGGWKPGTASALLSAVLAVFCIALPYQHAALAPFNFAEYAGFLATAVLVFALSASLQRKVSELNRSHLRFDGVVQISEDAIMTVDAQQNITLFNTGAEKIFGYQAAEVLGQSVDILLPEEFRQAHIAQLQVFAHSSDALRPMNLRRGIQGLRKNGKRFPAEASISKFDAEGNTVMTVRLRDVTQRVAAEDSLRQLAAIVESSQDAIIGEGLDGYIQSWNPGAGQMYGYTADEVLGKPAKILLPHGAEDEVAANLQRARQGISTNCDTVRMRKDGTQIKVAVTVSPIRDNHGVVIGASSISRDNTERLRLEMLLHQSQKMEAIGRLAGGVAHDFNNLLGVIIGYAYLIRNGSPSDERIRGASEQIITAAEKGSGLTHQLLAFGRRQVMNPRVIDLREVNAGLENIIPRLLGEDVDVRVIYGEGLKHVLADPSQIEQIIMNLVVNARDAMPDGGKLIIETSNVFFDTAQAGHHGVAPGDYVRLSVTDTGHGMTDEIRAHIFEPFFTTKEVGKGTGLGLATVHGIISQCHGVITVYSEPGHGTSFKIYLPATSSPVAATPLLPFESQERADSGSETLLLVEDQAPLRELLTQILRSKGYAVLSAKDGHDALKQAELHPGNVHLLLTDFIMPEMRGNDLAKMLVAKTPDLPVIFMSGYTDNALFENGTIPPDMVFLQKPFPPETMLHLVRHVLDKTARTPLKRSSSCGTSS